MKTELKNQLLLIVVAVALTTVAMVEPAFAQGIEVVNTKAQMFRDTLKGVSVVAGVVGVSIVGYQMMFKKAPFSETYPVLIGTVLVSGSSAIGSALMS